MRHACGGLARRTPRHGARRSDCRRRPPGSRARARRLALPRRLELGPRVLYHPSHALREWHGRTPVPGSPRHRGVERDPRDVTPPVPGVGRSARVSSGGPPPPEQLQGPDPPPPRAVGADPPGAPPPPPPPPPPP